MSAAAGKYIRDVRRAARLTQGEVAKWVGYSTSYVSDIERGARAAPGEFVAGLDELFPSFDRAKFFGLAPCSRCGCTCAGSQRAA